MVALHVTSFDLPAVAELARARFARDGLGKRATAVGGDVLNDRLPEGSDVISLIRVIHDHDDSPALAIMRAARAALSPGGALLLAEPVAGAGRTDPVGAYFSFYLLAMGSGRPRTSAGLKALLVEAGFGAVHSIPTAIPLLTSVIVAKAAA